MTSAMEYAPMSINGTFNKPKTCLEFHNPVWVVQTINGQYDGVVTGEESEISHDEGLGFTSMWACNAIPRNAGHLMPASMGLTILFAPTASE